MQVKKVVDSHNIPLSADSQIEIHRNSQVHATMANCIANTRTGDELDVVVVGQVQVSDITTTDRPKIRHRPTHLYRLLHALVAGPDRKEVQLTLARA